MSDTLRNGTKIIRIYWFEFFEFIVNIDFINLNYNSKNFKNI